MRRTPLLGAIPALAVTLLLALPREARAEPVLGVDLDLGTAFRRQVDFSYGLGGRLGYQLQFPLTSLFLQPEVGGHYMRFGSGNELGYFDHAGTVFGGARFGFGSLLQPSVFAHLGLGVASSSTLGPAADLGIGLDLRLIPVLSIGAQAAYNAVTIASTGDAAKWLSFGLTFGFHLSGGAATAAPNRP